MAATDNEDSNTEKQSGIMAASWRAFLKLCRKSVISLFLLVILGSLTLKNVDKRDGYTLSDVSELFVAKS